VGPDGDTLGSMLALKFAFEKCSPHLTRIDAVISGKIPQTYLFLPGIAKVKRIEDPLADLLPQYDLSICVDCGSADRLGGTRMMFEQATTSVNIDHHISNQGFAQINIIIPTAAASAEVVAGLLSEMNIPLDATIATHLFTGLVTDTGSFRYSNTTPKAFELGANLVKAGANPEYIYKNIFEENPKNQVLLQAQAITQMQTNADVTLGWTVVTQEMFSQFQAQEEHVDGLVEQIRKIDSILIAVVFKETAQGQTKLSVRSDSHDIDVCKIMSLFNGGGHKMAAGCTMNLSPEEAVAKIIPLFQKEIDMYSRKPLETLLS
jgi:phosphoesterase RecJ-like protein